MLSSFTSLYFLAIFICFCRSSLTMIKTTKAFLSQNRRTSSSADDIFVSFHGKVIFQSVMMMVFPLLFWFYLKLSSFWENCWLVSTGMLTVLWLMFAGFIISTFYHILIHKVKIFKEFSYGRFQKDLEFFWVMCPIVCGVLICLYDGLNNGSYDWSLLVTILAIVLGKYIWMDYLQFDKLKWAIIKPRVASFFSKHKSDFIILFYQAAVLLYLLVMWYPVKKGFIELSQYWSIHFLLLGIVFLPIMDRWLISSMGSNFYTS